MVSFFFAVREIVDACTTYGNGTLLQQCLQPKLQGAIIIDCICENYMKQDFKNNDPS